MKIYFCCLIILSALLSGCKNEESSENKILSLKINNIECPINESEKSITLKVERSQDITQLKPSVIISENATISPDCSKSIDFSKPITFTVTAEDGSIQNYSVKIEYLINTESNIVSFGINNIECVIGQTTITIKVHKSTDISALKPIVKLSYGATITPDCSNTIDFTNPVTFTVTSENGSIKKYQTKIETIRGITDFKMNIGLSSFSGSIDYKRNSINIDLPFDSINNLMKSQSLISNVKLYDNYSISPTSGSVITELESAVYTLTDSTGYSEAYNLNFRNKDNFMYSFSCPNELWTSSPDAYIHPDYLVGLPASNFFVVFIYKKYDISSIIPSATISKRATISPSLDIPTNFNQDITYKITSETGVSRDYKIRFIQKSILLTNDHSPNVYNPVGNGTSEFFVGSRSYSKVVGAQLVNLTSGNQIELDVLTNEFVPDVELHLYFKPRQVIPVGEYRLRVQLENNEDVITKCLFSRW